MQRAVERFADSNLLSRPSPFGRPSKIVHISWWWIAAA